MAISNDTVRDMAQLARLRVDEDEIEDLTQRFSAVLDLFEVLGSADVAGVAPMAHPLDATQTLRDDVVTEGNRRDELQAVAPLVENGLYLVPRVVE
jgi:aspartyl-tRNA(Asn)/glutamyl-tRNA(Gln) amidotransferase subunit C